MDWIRNDEGLEICALFITFFYYYKSNNVIEKILHFSFVISLRASGVNQRQFNFFIKYFSAVCQSVTRSVYLLDCV